MTPNQKHAARLREEARNFVSPTREALLVGAKALEGQGLWWLDTTITPMYLVPVDRWVEWHNWRGNREIGEASAIVPEWAIAVAKETVITGVELP